MSRDSSGGEGEGGGGGGGGPPGEPRPLTVVSAIEAYVQTAVKLSSASDVKKVTARAVIDASVALADATGVLRRAIKEGPQGWVASLGVPVPSILFNGRVLPGLNLQHDLMGAVQADMQLLQSAVTSHTLDDSVSPSVLHALVGRATVLSKATKKGGVVNDDENIALMILPGAGIGVSRFHPSIFAADADQLFFPLAAPEATPLVFAAAFVAAPGTEDTVKPVSMLLIDDLSTPHGLASAAAMLVFARGDGVGKNIPAAAAATASSVSPIIQPAAHMLTRAQSSLRLGLLHVPPLSAGSVTDTTTTAIGDVVAIAAALITGHAPEILEIRPDDAGPTLACIIDFARSTVAVGGTGNDLVNTLRTWLTTEEILPLKARAAVKLSDALIAAFPTTASAAKDDDNLSPFSKIREALAHAADVAREMLPVTLPATRAIEHQGNDVTVLRIRGLLANGRLLALRGNGGVNSNATATPVAVVCGSSPSDGASSLGVCATTEEVALLGSAEASARGAAVVRQLADASFPPELLPGGDPDALTAEYMSSVVATASAAVGASSRVASGSGVSATGRTSMRTEILTSKATSFTSSRSSGSGATGEGMSGESLGLSVVAIVDPASPDAQKTAPLLLLLRDALGARVTVYLVPPPGGSLTSLPIKSFFRYVLPATLSENRTALVRPRGVFAWLPSSTILTLKLAVPEPWNVQVSSASADCDNLKVQANDHIPVEFSLKDLLVAGSCVDVTRGSSTFPNGLQLALSALGDGNNTTTATTASPTLHDTLVMNNLGYWQLKAQPGVWSVHLASGSRSAEIFEVLVPSGGGGSGGGAPASAPHLWGGRSASIATDEVPAPAQSIAVRDFTGPFSTLHVRKRAGAEGMRLYPALGELDKGSSEFASSKGLMDSVRSFFGNSASSGSSSNAVAVDRPVVHVFSIASGHLYERFLKIMMVAAIRRSPSVRLKFWLVENFLSPAFKESAPQLAQSLGAEVAFVTYKWPNWLRAQTEKQRIIWGYKILFLDVLFPLDVKRIIYIDADQVVRTDLRELAEMDLHGAPYAFTPFCESRKETLGYQFWREGFWKEHLRGRPYHISALFVVDLVLFRRMAAGDMLRALYDQLSRDPNSLANLDQDLPNCKTPLLIGLRQHSVWPQHKVLTHTQPSPPPPTPPPLQLLKIKSLFIHYHKNGSGVNPGAQMHQKPRRKPSTYVIIQR